MGVRGRKTLADKVVQLRTLAAMGLPAPPRWLSREEAEEWNEIVATYPPDRFPRSTWPMLEGYCRHAVHARRIGDMIEAASKKRGEAALKVRDYNMMLMMLDRETKAVASFGVRLGIARTSMAGRHNNDPDAVAETDLPWEDK